MVPLGTSRGAKRHKRHSRGAPRGAKGVTLSFNGVLNGWGSELLNGELTVSFLSIDLKKCICRCMSNTFCLSRRPHPYAYSGIVWFSSDIFIIYLTMIQNSEFFPSFSATLISTNEKDLVICYP